MLCLTFILCLSFIPNSICDIQYGPDPWNSEIIESNRVKHEDNVPPDLKINHRRKDPTIASGVGMSEWFYKRILAILMKGGKIKKEDCGYIDVTLKMHFPEEHWEAMNSYLSSQSPLSEDMYRRSIGYVQDAITRPTVTETLVLAWTDYVQFYLVEYKFHITWVLGLLGALFLTRFIWHRMSHKHFYFMIFIVIYLYEVFLSYKEAEQQEYEKFVSSINTCKWYFWSSSCDIPPPDPLIFIKHMHPLKVGLRIFSMLVSEPMIAISSTVKVMLQGLTDGLWFPLDKIVYSVLILIIYAFLIAFFVMVLFNFILNIPFNVSFLLGMVNIGIRQRNRTFIGADDNNSSRSVDQGDRLSGANLDRLLNVCAKALSDRDQPNHKRSDATNSIELHKNSGLRKSASTGRLSDLVLERPTKMISNNKNKHKVKFENGSGDYF